MWRVKRRLNPKLRLLGLLPTMYQADDRHAIEVVHELREVFGPKVFDIIINTDSSFAEAPVVRQTILTYDPNSEGAAAFRKLAEEIADGKPRR